MPVVLRRRKEAAGARARTIRRRRRTARGRSNDRTERVRLLVAPNSMHFPLGSSKRRRRMLIFVVFRLLVENNIQYTK